MILEAGVSQLA